MNRIFRKKNDNYTVISNVFLRDENLSLKAKGLLAVVMGLPEDWDFTINGMCTILKEGKTAIYNTINELKDNGYCSVVVCRNEKGVILGNDYSFHEDPSMENPYTGNPDMDNKTQLNTYNNKVNNKISKDKKKGEKFDLSFVSFEFTDVFNEWLDYKKERRESYKSEKSVLICYKKLVSLSGNNPNTAKKIVEQSIANNWSGLFALKNNNNGTGKGHNSCDEEFYRNIAEGIARANTQQ